MTKAQSYDGMTAVFFRSFWTNGSNFGVKGGANNGPLALSYSGCTTYGENKTLLLYPLS